MVSEKRELVRVVNEVMHLVVRDCLHFVCSLSLKPLLVCLQVRNAVMIDCVPFSFELKVAHLYMLRK